MKIGMRKSTSRLMVGVTLAISILIFVAYLDDATSILDIGLPFILTVITLWSMLLVKYYHTIRLDGQRLQLRRGLFVTTLDVSSIKMISTITVDHYRFANERKKLQVRLENGMTIDLKYHWMETRNIDSLLDELKRLKKTIIIDRSVYALTTYMY